MPVVPEASELTFLGSISSLDRLAPCIRAIGERAQLPYLSRTTSLGDCNSDCRLVHIQSNVRDKIHLACLPCMRLCAGLPAQPSYLARRETGRPLWSPRTYGLGANEDEPFMVAGSMALATSLAVKVLFPQIFQHCIGDEVNGLHFPR